MRAFLYTWGGRKTAEGEKIPVRIEELDIGYIDGMLLLPLVVEHGIDERSPLYGHTFESLRVWPSPSGLALHHLCVYSHHCITCMRQLTCFDGMLCPQLGSGVCAFAACHCHVCACLGLLSSSLNLFAHGLGQQHVTMAVLGKLATG